MQEDGINRVVEPIETVARIRMRRPLFHEVLRHLMASENREEGVYLACDTFMHRHQVELLVRDFMMAPRRGMQLSSRHISAHPGFIAGAVDYAGLTRGSVIVGHSHPFSEDNVQLTALDREGEADLVPRLQKRIPYAHHGTIIFGRRSALVRLYRPASNRPLMGELVVDD